MLKVKVLRTQQYLIPDFKLLGLYDACLQALFASIERQSNIFVQS
jgi:hypothetical protein